MKADSGKNESSSLLAGNAAGNGVDAVRLTPTQIKVMRGVHSGLLNKQIAFDLGIAEKTVKAHMTALMRKLNLRNRTQVAVAAQTILNTPKRNMAAEGRVYRGEDAFRA